MDFLDLEKGITTFSMPCWDLVVGPAVLVQPEPNLVLGADELCQHDSVQGFYGHNLLLLSNDTKVQIHLPALIYK